MSENEIAKLVVDAAYKAQVSLGPGNLESARATVLCHELKKRVFIPSASSPLQKLF